MSPNIVRDLLFQAAKHGSVDEFNEAIHQSRKHTKPVINDLMECNEDGDSPLHVAIKSGHHNLVEYMLTWSKCGIKFDGGKRRFEVPYCNEKGENYSHKLSEVASNIFGISDKVSILYIFKHLIKPAMNDDILWLKFVLECVTVSKITRSEKIVALEILGAAFILQNTLTKSDLNNNDGCFMGIKCWKQSLTLRNSTDDGGPALTNIPRHLPNVLGDHVEFLTPNELEHLEHQLLFHELPYDWQFFCEAHGPLVVQALLVIQRIFNETSYEILNKILYAYGTHCFCSKESIFRSFDVFHLILNQIEQLDGTPSLFCLEMFTSSLHYMSIFLIKANKVQFDNPTITGKVKSADLLTLIKFSIKLAALLPRPARLDTDERILSGFPFLFCLQDVANLLVEMFAEFNAEETQQLKEYLLEYVLKKFDETFLNLLTVVVWHLYSDNHAHVDDEIYIQMIKMLLVVGFNPNTTTIAQCESPLHYLARCWVKSWSPNLHRTVFLTLLDAGGNLDLMAINGTTVRSVLKYQKTQLINHDPYLDSLINMPVPWSLRHMSAKVIRQRRIPFEDKLPASLQSFILCRRI